MKNNRFSRLIIVIVSIFIFIFLSVYFIGSNRGKILNNTYASTPVSYADKFVGSPFKFISNLNSDISNLFNTFEQNKVLKEKNFKLTEASLTISKLEKENLSLRDSLEIKENFSPNTLILADVITRTPVSWINELILDKGSKDGISDQMLALSNGNLIGKVTDISKGSSTVQLLTNSNLAHQIPVQINTSTNTVYGIITKFDFEKELILVEQLNNNSEIRQGDTVVTSGLDGDSVSAIPVGSVKEVSDDKKVVYVSLNADFDIIESVTLVGAK